MLRNIPSYFFLPFKIAKNVEKWWNITKIKKKDPPHSLFWEWPMARRGGYHMFRICLYDLDTLPDSISSTLDIVWLLCNTSKCVKNAVFRKKTLPSEIQKHHNSSIYLKWKSIFSSCFSIVICHATCICPSH